uniref:Uncharacterized protein n=1 Tax=Rhizophora mucronata TaxID=61149 RepID=A0A2P2NFT7_RHIMU
MSINTKKMVSKVAVNNMTRKVSKQVVP